MPGGAPSCSSSFVCRSCSHSRSFSFGSSRSDRSLGLCSLRCVHRNCSSLQACTYRALALGSRSQGSDTGGRIGGGGGGGRHVATLNSDSGTRSVEGTCCLLKLGCFRCGGRLSSCTLP